MKLFNFLPPKLIVALSVSQRQADQLSIPLLFTICHIIILCLETVKWIERPLPLLKPHQFCFSDFQMFVFFFFPRTCTQTSPLMSSSCLPCGSPPLAQQSFLQRWDSEVDCSLATEMSDMKEVTFASHGKLQS